MARNSLIAVKMANNAKNTATCFHRQKIGITVPYIVDGKKDTPLAGSSLS
jgi:hypothetical protein